MAKARKLKIEELYRKSIEEFKNSSKFPVVVVLDNVRSLNNIGSIFRTCDALNVEKIVLCGISATPPNTEIHKTALGAEDSMQWDYYEKAEEAIRILTEQGYQIYALEQTTDSVDIREFEISTNKKYAFVFGNELKGVAQGVIDGCKGAIEIPQFGTKHSFNVSVTAGIVIWDFFVKFTSKGKGA
jgi:tRNA G18 (ribose-2'-O)-methylase SpoU